MSAWHILDQHQRQILRDGLQCGDVEWLRGMAWAFQQAMGLLVLRRVKPDHERLGATNPRPHCRREPLTASSHAVIRSDGRGAGGLRAPPQEWPGLVEISINCQEDYAELSRPVTTQTGRPKQTSG